MKKRKITAVILQHRKLLDQHFLSSTPGFEREKEKEHKKLPTKDDENFFMYSHHFFFISES